MSKRRIKIFDTTLRDGEQSPRAGLTPSQKLQIARQLDLLGVDIIEAGFPISSPADLEAVQMIAEEVRRPTICALARVVPKDIEAAWEGVKNAEKPRIHVFVGTSQPHVEKKLRKTPEEIVDMAAEGVKLAKSFCHDVEFSPEDATRTDRGFIKEVVEAAIENGATVINLPDTVGYTTPWEYEDLIRWVRENVAGIEKTTISVHCHNDLGLAVANSLAAIRAGATQVECTINGIGERAGNAALEEIVMGLHTRGDFYADVECQINTRQLLRTSRLVSQLTGIVVQPNKAVVGANAFAHESGIHQDGVLKARETYEIMDPQSVGAEGTELVLGARSGRHALKHRLENLGYEVDDEALERYYQRFLTIADSKKEVFDEDLIAIVEDETGAPGRLYEIVSLHSFSGTGAVPTASVEIRMPDGNVVRASGTGNGPIDAAYNAIDAAIGREAKLLEFSLSGVTGSRDAVGQARVKIEIEGRTAVGLGASTDVVEASARAYVSAINRALTNNASGRKRPRAR